MFTLMAVSLLHMTASHGTTPAKALIISVASLVLFLPLGRHCSPESRWGSYQDAYFKSLVLIMLTAASFTLVRYLAISRPLIGGVDWYYYLCYSRDMVNGYPVSENVYSYFPGVYAFWTTVMRLVGQDIVALQVVYQLMLVAVSLLTAWVIHQQTRCKLLTGIGFFWTFILFTKFDGLAGVTETLAVTVWLIGLIVWKGERLRSGTGWSTRRWILFGVALGLTVVTKQQAGLLCLGFLYLVSEQRRQAHQWIHLLLLPVIAAVALGVSILYLGEGLRPLSVGLTTAGQYGTQQSWLLNLYTQIRHDESLWISLLVAAVLFLKRKQFLAASNDNQESSWRLVGFTLVAALATLIQFRARPFHHYMLLAIPAMVIACSLTLFHYRTWLQQSGFRRALVGSILMLPFVWCAPYNDSYHPLQLLIPESSQWNRQFSSHHDAAMHQLIDSLDKTIPTESRLLIMPGRYNQIHYGIGSLADLETGYSFQTRQFAASDESWLAPLTNTQAEYVLVLTGSVITKAEMQQWTGKRLELVQKTLRSRNYQDLSDTLPPGEGMLFRKQ